MKPLLNILWKVLTTRVAWPILLTMSLLCLASLRALQLASPQRADKQETWLLVAAGVVIAAIVPHFHLLGRMAYALYGLAMVLLVAVFLAPRVANTHRWFVLPGDVQLQPSELAKIAFVLALAWYLRYRKNLGTFSGLLIPFGLALIPFGLILVEPDLGTALLFPLVLYAMLIAAGAKIRHLVIIALVALFAVPGAFPFLQPYQQQRIKSLVMQFTGRADPGQINGPGYQAYQSQAAIGSGGVTGQGEEAGKNFGRGLLPEAYTDFIFAVIGAEWGLMGCLVVLVMYLLFYAAAVEISASTRDQFGRLLVVGVAAMLMFQATINMAMTMGVMPVVGIALPFVSYGGSSLLASALMAGLLLNVSVRRKFQSAAK